MSRLEFDKFSSVEALRNFIAYLDMVIAETTDEESLAGEWRIRNQAMAEVFRRER